MRSLSALGWVVAALGCQPQDPPSARPPAPTAAKPTANASSSATQAARQPTEGQLIWKQWEREARERRAEVRAAHSGDPPGALPPLANADAISRMDATMTQGHVFRQLFVGGLEGLGGRLFVSRITWVLEREGAGGRLTLFCERFHRGPGKVRNARVSGSKARPHLLGEANRRDLWWAAPATTVYSASSAPHSAQTAESKSRFELQSFEESVQSRELGAGGRSCGTMPSHLTLVCKTTAMMVRPRGAHMAYLPIVENMYSTSWLPPTRTSVRGLGCNVPELIAPPHRRPAITFIEKLPRPPLHNTGEYAPLFFVDRTSVSPGVEFAYANHDAGMQAGDYRWILVQ